MAIKLLRGGRRRALATTFLTSPPYPYIITELLNDNHHYAPDAVLLLIPTDTANDTFIELSGTLRVIFASQTQPAEHCDDTFIELSGTLRMIFVSQTQPAEHCDDMFIEVSGTLNKMLVSYIDWPEESCNDSFISISGTLL